MQMAGQRQCNWVVSANANDWSVAMQLGGQVRCNFAAVAEISVISQLDKAMTGNISSMESLVQAEGLLGRARKGGFVTIEEQAKYQDQLGKAYGKIEKAEAKELAQKQKLIEAENRQIDVLKRTVNGIEMSCRRASWPRALSAYTRCTSDASAVSSKERRSTKYQFAWLLKC